MKMELIVLGVSSYDMTGEGGQKGASVKVVGEKINTPFYTGLSITNAAIDYSDLEKFRLVELPSKFSVTPSLVNVKQRSGKEVAGLKLSNPVFVSNIDFTLAK